MQSELWAPWSCDEGNLIQDESFTVQYCDFQLRSIFSLEDELDMLEIRRRLCMSENSGSGKKGVVKFSRRTQALACPEVTGELRGQSVCAEHLRAL